MPQNSAANAPIGVFDSGIGGLSVLAALREELPDEHFVYIGDAGHAPYGERDTAHVLQRSQRLAEYLCKTHQAKALVLACNTATAAAVSNLRAHYPSMPIVGIEPAIKPAAAQSASGVVAVMATRSTLASDKFLTLLKAQPQSVHFLLQACDGLAAAIEGADYQKIESLSQDYVNALRRRPEGGPSIDTVVLGCTHYALISDTLSRLWGPQVTLLEAGQPVARRTRQVLESAAMVRKATTAQAWGQDQRPLICLSTGDPSILNQALHDWHIGSPAVHASGLHLP